LTAVSRHYYNRR